MFQALAQSTDLEIQLDIFQSIIIETPLHFPLLQKFTITETRLMTDTTVRSERVHDIRMLLHDVPALTSIALNSLAWPVIRSFSPYNSVKSVDCFYSPTDHLRPLLDFFPSLNHLHLRVIRYNIPVVTSSPVIFPHLQNLTIQDEDVIPDLDTLIKAFNTPSLSQFALTTPGCRTRDHHLGSSLVQCLRQSGCNLQTLRISAPNTSLSSDPYWILDVVDLSPELRTLHLEFCAPKESDATAVVVSVMLNTVVYRLYSSLSDSPASMLPLLSTLTVRIYKFPIGKSWNSTTRDIATSFLHMVESRADSNASLRHAELVISHSFHNHRSGGMPAGNVEGVEELEAFHVDLARRCESLLVNYGVTVDLDIPR
ncbi:hypothetical protein PM082_012622 [Marasmius tenuissimus]|nr:hypothetical protein PM082_012622 [Marasmius tenuissimus]